MNFTRVQIEQAVKAKGYVWFENGAYNINIVGIRNGSTNNEVTNKFDDLITVTYKDRNGRWNFREYPATTDPGTHWEQNLLNAKGVAILKEGQYRGSHMIGLHQDTYEALKQKTPLSVYRDKNKDGDFDLLEENIQEGIFGINIHRATKWGTSNEIGRWSAGCQVIANNEDFEEFMSLARKSSQLYGNSFTYTLINSNDIV